ncbi:hypothetical protein MYSTI_03627 [Myxococcus stipitatus DSM 14675]|uniref:Lipoprotein n=1 Tax=Myxococcus stipitatus (strain DSM 14675 / JCM 12634 / Mx s8) TaxID=1278073 RepID=L7UA79_MYXSD|nr:hypothetical protein [Myxococcus stipitatus]AGC44933.1 hypothetical protein MYSTI_03627 [Myxococcus stipitatus DSM 14675]
MVERLNPLIGKRILALLLVLPGCSLFQRPPRPVHAPPEESAKVEIPLAMSAEGRQVIRGAMVRAIQLAMDDFLPWDHKLPGDATPLQQCLSRRDAYDVAAVPGPKGVMFVTLIPNPDVCDVGGPPILDVGATYAIDVVGWRILSVQQ